MILTLFLALAGDTFDRYERPPVKAIPVPAPAPASSPTPWSPAPLPPDVGTGGFSRVAGGGTAVFGEAGRLLTYCVRVEDGIHSFDPYDLAGVVDTALADSRSWIASRRWRFQRVPDCENAWLRANLATPATVDSACRGAARTEGLWSCFNLRAIHINLDRWKLGVEHAAGDLTTYRMMVINHEVGHALGFGHVGCPGAGRAAPVMLPQSRELNGCVLNPYPYPDGVHYLG